MELDRDRMADDVREIMWLIVMPMDREEEPRYPYLSTLSKYQVFATCCGSKSTHLWSQSHIALELCHQCFD